MALSALTGSVVAEQGETAMRANFIHKVEFDGDAAYATGGSVAFQQFVRDVVGEQVTIGGISGYGLNAAGTAFTHFLHYDAATDKLQVFLLAGAEVGNGVDLSATKFHAVVFSA